MTTSLLRPLAAAIALLFVVAACASDSGPEWTFAPASAGTEDSTEDSTGEPTVETIEDDIESDTSETAGETEPPPDEPVTDAEADEPPATDGPVVTEVPSATEAPVVTEAPVTSETPMVTDEPTAIKTPSATAQLEPSAARTIDLLATSSISFTGLDGEKVTEIVVTPGETIVFQVDNTAGFDHSFFIGEQEVVSVGGATTEVGTRPWQSGIREIEWVVPEDLTDIEFACTVPGHYSIMHGTFAFDS